MYVILAKVNLPLIKDIIGEKNCKIVSETTNTTTLKVTDVTLSKIKYELRKCGYNPFVYLHWF